MEPPAIISELRFPVGQYSAVSNCRPGGLRCRSGLSLSIGSQWLRHLPTKLTAPDGAASDALDTPFPSRAIFGRRGILADPGVTDAGAAYLFQLEANGSATYLTKATAPDGAATIIWNSVSQSGNILAVGALCRSRGFPMLGLLIFFNWKPMINYLPDQGHRSRRSR